MSARVFVTVGSQKFQFNRLLAAVDGCVASGVIDVPVFAQTGCSDYSPKNFEWRPFLDRDEFSSLVEGCDTVVTHGGTGAIVGALKKGKRVVAMPRLAKYGEHVDDHQVQLLEQFSEAGLILVCEDEESLAEAYRASLSREFAIYEPNNERFIGDLDRYLSKEMLSSC